MEMSIEYYSKLLFATVIKSGQMGKCHLFRSVKNIVKIARK